MSLLEQEERDDWQEFQPGPGFGGDAPLSLFGVSPGTPSPSKLDEPPIAAKIPAPDPSHPLKDPLARELATPRGRAFVPNQRWSGPNAIQPSGMPFDNAVVTALKHPAKPRFGGGGGEEPP